MSVAGKSNLSQMSANSVSGARPQRQINEQEHSFRRGEEQLPFFFVLRKAAVKPR